MSRPLIFVLLFVAGILAVVGAVMEEISAPLWVTAALAGVVAVVGILVKKPLERIGDRVDPLIRGKHLIHGRPLRVRDTATDVHGFLGVHHARYRDPGNVHSDRLPDYVPRRDLERRVRECLEAHGIVVVTGGSATGKSRLAYEVLRELYPDRHLYRPVFPHTDGKGVRGIVEEGLLPRKAVFWLDGLEAHLARGLRAEDVIALVPPGSGNVVVATMRIHPGGTRTDGNRDEQDQEAFLRRFSGSEVNVPRGNKGYDEQACDDPRIHEAFAQKRSSVTEYLAQGPAAHERWRRLTADSHTHRVGAVITAAVDSRRAGRHAPLSVELLRELHEYYIDGSEGAGAGRQNFDEALSRAAEPINGASGCLLRSDWDPGAYYAFDYLVDRAQAENGGPVNTRVLEALVETTEGPELVSLGRSAVGEPRLALRAADKRLGENSEDAAAWGLKGTMLLVEKYGIDVGGKEFGALKWDEETPEAVDCLRRAVDGGDETVILFLGTFLHRSERNEEALRYLERVEEADAFVHQRIGMCLRELGRYEEALESFERAGRQGLILAHFSFSDTLAKMGNPELALAVYDDLIELARDEELRAVELQAMRKKGELLLVEKRIAEAVEFAEEGAGRGEAWAFDLLTTHFEGIGNHGMVSLWRNRAADAGMLWALRETGVLSDVDLYQSRDTWRSRVRDAGDQRSEWWLASAELAVLAQEIETFSQEAEEVAREGEERLQEDTSWIQKVLKAGGDHHLADFEDETEKVDEPLPDGPVDEEVLEDDEPSIETRAAELRSEGRHRELVVLLGQEVAAGRDEFVAPLDEALDAVAPTERAELLREVERIEGGSLRIVLLRFRLAGLEDRAEELLLAEQQAGNQWAANQLTDLYEHQERFPELREHLRHQIYLGSPTAAANLVDHLAGADGFEIVYQSLRQSLASWARSGGEMSVSMYLPLPMADDEERFLAEAAEAGIVPAHVSLLIGLLDEGRIEEAEEVFIRGEHHTRLVYRPGAYLSFAKKLVERGEDARAEAVLDRIPRENLVEDQEAELREIRAGLRSAREREK